MPGPTELIIILLIIVVLFGVGRIGKIAGELGGGIRAFREGLLKAVNEYSRSGYEGDDVREAMVGAPNCSMAVSMSGVVCITKPL